MAEEEEPGLIDQCKTFVRSMARAEQAIGAATQTMGREERKAALAELLRWVETTPEIPAEGLTREVAREILGQMSAFMVYDDYQGSTDRYIQ
jgi:hypothetical protein